MIGCDPDAVKTLAVRYSSLARMVDELEALGHSLSSLNWNGDDADTVRSDWRRRIEPQAAESSTTLQELNTILSRNADRQRETSRGIAISATRSATLGSWDVVQSQQPWDSLKRYQNWVLGPMGALVDAAGGLVVDVSGYTRGGASVSGHLRWWPRTADPMNSFFGSAGSMKRWAGGLKLLGPALDFGVGACEQHEHDVGFGAAFPTDVQIGRDVTSGAVDAGIGFVAGWVGGSAAAAAAAAATPFTTPVGGVAIGAGVGIVVSVGTEEMLDWAVDESGAKDWLVDRGGEVGDFVGDRVDEVAGEMSGGWKAVKSWF